MPYYRSRILAFVGTEENPNFPSTQLILWDDLKKNKTGVIMCNEKVLDFRFTKQAIFLFLRKKIILFDVISLQYITTIEDFEYNPCKISLNSNSNPVIFAFCSWSNKSQVKVNKCIKQIFNFIRFNWE